MGFWHVPAAQNATSHTRVPVTPAQGNCATHSELVVHEIAVDLSTKGEEVVAVTMAAMKAKMSDVPKKSFILILCVL